MRMKGALPCVIGRVVTDRYWDRAYFNFAIYKSEPRVDHRTNCFGGTPRYASTGRKAELTGGGGGDGGACAGGGAPARGFEPRSESYSSSDAGADS